MWLDEEPPSDIYFEGLLRTMDCDGRVMCTFTPLLGMSTICQNFLRPEDAKRYVVQIEWDECSDLSEQAKQDLLASIPPYQREARSKGVPILGAGAIYPVSESDFVIDPFELPEYYPRCYGLDVGWNRTAAVWMARDNESQTYFLTHGSITSADRSLSFTRPQLRQKAPGFQALSVPVRVDRRRLTAPEATRELINISHKAARPSNQAAPRTTNAPKPPSPVSGTSRGEFNVNDESIDADSWFRMRNADLKRRGK